MENNNLVQFGVAWKKQSKASGKEYLSGKGGDQKQGLTLLLRNAAGEEFEVTNFMVFSNDKKTKDTQPDFRFMVSVE